MDEALQAKETSNEDGSDNTSNIGTKVGTSIDSLLSW